MTFYLLHIVRHCEKCSTEVLIPSSAFHFCKYKMTELVERSSIERVFAKLAHT